MGTDKALDNLIKGIIKIARRSIREAKFNKGYTGRVMAVVDTDTYVVSINNKPFKAKSKLNLDINDIVKVISWNNDMNELYIIFAI